MHTGHLIFAQLMDFLPLAAFRRCVACCGCGLGGLQLGEGAGEAFLR